MYVDNAPVDVALSHLHALRTALYWLTLLGTAVSCCRAKLQRVCMSWRSVAANQHFHARTMHSIPEADCSTTVPQMTLQAGLVKVDVGSNECPHMQGIIHRDLKANNIFLSSGGILKLGDFGISKALGEQQAARTMVGTPYYMSPEILKGKLYDSKTDVWALGCVLYEMCSLKKAFEAGNLGAITVKIMR